MKNSHTMSATNTKNTQINARQLSFFCALVLPVGKLLELPSLLTSYAGGDLLIAALLGSAVEFLAFLALVLFAKRKGAPIEALEARCGKPTARIFLGVYTLFLLAFSVLPLFDLERFSHAAFSDTSPTFFTFTPFLVLAGFICAKGLKGVGRSADLTPILCLFPLLLLIAMSVGQADFSRLLPVVEKPISVSVKAAWKTLPYFSSGGLLLPLMSGYSYEKGDEKKLFPAFFAGILLLLLFLATFFATFGLLGETEHFALMKIGQYFPALRFIGRVDLLLVYLVTVALFYYTALPLQLSVECFCRCFSIKNKVIPSAALCVGLYFALLFLNKYNNAIHAFFFSWLPTVFLVFSTLLPIAFLLLFGKKDGGRYEMNEKTNNHKGDEKA
ncbi:MAG: GerAB/ArcD/ProY family transporter [Clostridia bacterium]|nr:GerAB/ArcD/ProY family transporter [Clostridia bacterium]